MKQFNYNQKTYDVDQHNFLIDQNSWDENFALGMAEELGMTGGLTDRQWEVIHYIRKQFLETGACPVVHDTTRILGLNMQSLKQLFPTGYLRGACLLAGICYRHGWVYYFGEPYSVSDKSRPDEKIAINTANKTYHVDLFGYLVDFTEWDEAFATRRAYEMNMKNGLTDKHWQVINFLRERYAQTKKIPNIYECCEANDIDFDEFASLFPAGYHRGTVKIAGLSAWE